MGPWSQLASGLHPRVRLLNLYFANAVKVYALLGEEDARMAALAAAMASTPDQRRRQAETITATAHDLGDLAADSEQVADKLLKLASQITGTDWSVRDAVAHRQLLARANPEYARALGGLAMPDPDVFVYAHPDLFVD